MEGKIPAVLYGGGSEAAPVAVDPRQVLRILRSESGHNTIFDLALDSNRVKAMIVDWQYEPIKGRLLHVDMQRIAMDKKLHGDRADRAEGRSRGREDKRAAFWSNCCARSRSSACRRIFRRRSMWISAT